MSAVKSRFTIPEVPDPDSLLGEVFGGQDGSIRLATVFVRLLARREETGQSGSRAAWFVVELCLRPLLFL